MRGNHVWITDLDGLFQMTGNDASRMAESAAINKSLSVLGQVVHALNQGAVSDLSRLYLDSWLLTIPTSLVSHTEIRN